MSTSKLETGRHHSLEHRRKIGAAQKGEQNHHYMHGMTGTPEFRAYSGARQRCNNPRNKSYSRYGGRGIRFLFASFEDFYNEIGPKPSAGYSVHRIDNDVSYQKGNVHWQTAKGQANNRHKPQLSDEERQRRGIYFRKLSPTEASLLARRRSHTRYHINRGLVSTESNFRICFLCRAAREKKRRRLHQAITLKRAGLKRAA